MQISIEKVPVPVVEEIRMRVGLSYDLKETMAHEAGAPDR
jgi:hypothetical protein